MRCISLSWYCCCSSRRIYVGHTVWSGNDNGSTENGYDKTNLNMNHSNDAIATKHWGKHQLIVHIISLHTRMFSSLFRYSGRHKGIHLTCFNYFRYIWVFGCCCCWSVMLTRVSARARGGPFEVNGKCSEVAFVVGRIFVLSFCCCCCCSIQFDMSATIQL